MTQQRPYVVFNADLRWYSLKLRCVGRFEVELKGINLGRRALLVFFGTIALILLTMVVALGGMILAAYLLPWDTAKEGQAGIIFLLPVFWLWKRFLSWCGLEYT